MMKLFLSNNRTMVDMQRLAEAFSISRAELETRIALGTITVWFERGDSDRHAPRMVFHSSDTGARVTLDPEGNVLSSTGGGGKPQQPPSNDNRDQSMPGVSDARPFIDNACRSSTTPEPECRSRRKEHLDETSKETFPAQ